MVKTGSLPGTSGTQHLLQPPTPPGTASVPAKPDMVIPNKSGLEKKIICHFFTLNKCKFGKDCRKDHPKICIKFKKHGLKKFNKLGCEENCGNYHPKACFEAMKTKNCKRPDCKFYHILGTKKAENVPISQTPTLLPSL